MYDFRLGAAKQLAAANADALVRFFFSLEFLNISLGFANAVFDGAPQNDDARRLYSSSCPFEKYHCAMVTTQAGVSITARVAHDLA